MASGGTGDSPRAIESLWSKLIGSLSQFRSAGKSKGMGQCVSKSGSEHSRGNAKKSNPGHGGPVMTVGPDGVEVPVDNRPVLQQQPRRKSVDGASMPPAPSRETTDPRKQPVTVTSSQLEFFKMLDEKIEQGVIPPGEEGTSAAADAMPGSPLASEKAKLAEENVPTTQNAVESSNHMSSPGESRQSAVATPGASIAASSDTQTSDISVTAEGGASQESSATNAGSEMDASAAIDTNADS